jgi:hypothetical protein
MWILQPKKGNSTMAFDDELDTQNQDELAKAQAQKRFAVLFGSLPRPPLNGAPSGRQDETTPWSENIPGIGPANGAPSRPRIPATTTTPVTPPTIDSGGASGQRPSLLSAVRPAPTRPDVMPTRADFPAKPELGGWKKYLGLGLATLAGSAPLAENILHGQADRAERQYQRANQEWEEEQADRTREAQIRNIDSEIKARNDKPDQIDKKIDEYTNDQQQRVTVMQRPDNTTYERVGGKVFEKPDEPKAPPHITTLGKDGQPHIMERDPKTGEYSIDRGRAPKDMGKGEEGRSDKSYQFHADRIDKLRKPVEDRAERISRVEDTLNQGTPQADALIAPELLSVMAGGQGSGVRQNEAELARIVGGRNNWETLKAKVDAWKLDPSKGFALTPAQRGQTRALFQAVKDRVSRKMAAIDEESGNLLNTDDPKEHRRIYQRLQKRLGDIDTGGGQATGGAVDKPPSVNIPSGWQWIQQGGQWGITDGKVFRPYQGK